MAIISRPYNKRAYATVLLPSVVVWRYCIVANKRCVYGPRAKVTIGSL